MYKMKWSLKDPVFLILIFIVVRLTVLMWDSPFYTTPSEKTVNVIKGVGVFIACLGSGYMVSYKRGRELRGEVLPDTDRRYDYLIVIINIVWVIVWEFLDLTNSRAHPVLHYFIMLVGYVIITFVWFELDTLTDLW